ncbi:tetratricopeptide (TPR) repeat protein [Catenulispora sp. GAS73]
MGSQRLQDSHRALLGFFGALAFAVFGAVAVAVIARIGTRDGLSIGFSVIGAALLPLLAFGYLGLTTMRPRARGGRTAEPFSQSPDTATPELPNSFDAAVALSGRAKLVSEIEQALESGAGPGRAPVVNIYGPPGIGKTTITKILARRTARQVLLARLEPDEKTDKAKSGTSRILAELLEQMDAPTDALQGTNTNGADKSLTQYRQRLRSGTYLLVLDDVSVMDQVRELLPQNAASCAVLVTRNKLSDSTVTQSYEVGNLDDGDALTLLGQAADFDRVKREIGAAELIIRLCGNMPLALSIAGARLALRPYWSLGTFAARLLDEQTRLDELQLGEVGVRKNLSVSYKDLTAVEKRAFRRLGMLDQVVASWVVAPLLDVSYIDADQIAKRLAEANLLQEVWSSDRRDRRYGMHELVKCYAQEVLIDDSDADRKAAVERLTSAYTTLAHHVADQLDTVGPARRGGFAVVSSSALTLEDLEHITGTTPLRFLVAESRAMVATVKLATQFGLTELCWQAAVAALPFFEVMRGAWGSWTPPAEIPAPASSADASAEDEVWEQAMMHLVRGTHATAVDHYDVADEHFQHAQDLFRKAGDEARYAETVRRRGEAQRVRGHYTDATIWLQEARECSTRTGDVLGEARALLDLGNCHRVAHLDARALKELKKALAIFRDRGERFEEARALRALGILEQQSLNTEKSEEYLVEALGIFESFEAYKGNSYWAACTRYSLGKLRLDQDRPQEAAEMLDTALAAFEGQSGSRLWRARIHRQLAHVSLAEGRLDEARQHAQTAYELCENLELQIWMAHAKRTLAEVSMAEGDLEETERLLTEAKETYDQVWNPWYAAEAAWKLALAYSELHKDKGKAIPLLYEAVSGFGKIDDNRRREVVDHLTMLSRPVVAPVTKRLGMALKRSA